MNDSASPQGRDGVQGEPCEHEWFTSGVTITGFANMNWDTGRVQDLRLEHERRWYCLKCGAMRIKLVDSTPKAGKP